LFSSIDDTFNGDVVYISRLPSLLTPVLKNKGNIAEVINNRGITVLPVINKIIETIINQRLSRACIVHLVIKKKIGPM
jgi:hypothetical protein